MKPPYIALIAVATFFLGWILGTYVLPIRPFTMSPGTVGMMHAGGGSMMMAHPVVKTDAEFIMAMIPHHQEAVDTSRYVLSRTSDPDIQGFLQGIINAQTKEIEQMKSWHRDWFGTEYRDDGRYQPMMPNLQGLSEERAVATYLHGMVMHHMGAVEMARQALGFTKRAELTNFAQDVIRVQTEEISIMLSWLRDGYGGGSGMMMH